MPPVCFFRCWPFDMQRAIFPVLRHSGQTTHYMKAKGYCIGTKEQNSHHKGCHCGCQVAWYWRPIAWFFFFLLFSKSNFIAHVALSIAVSYNAAFFCTLKCFAHREKVFVKFTPHNKHTPNFASIFQKEKCVHCGEQIWQCIREGHSYTILITVYQVVAIPTV